jgi:hypothetical protein
LDAVDTLTIKLQFGRYAWVVEADIKPVFKGVWYGIANFAVLRVPRTK